MTMASSQADSTEALERLLHMLDAAGKSEFSGNPDDEPLEEDPKVDMVPGGIKFEGSEHRAIGDAIKVFSINGQELDASSYVVQTIARHGTGLTLGRVISLAGDFYSNRTPSSWGGFKAEYAPICGAYYNPPPGTPENRFNDMVQAMLLDDFNYIEDIKGALDLEKSELDKLKGPDGGSAARAFHTDDKLHTDVWFSAKTSLAYPKIAWQNADHFGDDALFCYKVGHAMACNAAAKAGLASGDGEKTKQLNSAYFIEACSLHYLTDMFSSGHMRAPRRAFHYTDYSVMIEVGPLNIPVWDSQCRFMHDDDNATGLLCKNEKGDQWVAFGDKQFFMPANGVNRARVIHAVQTSVREVFSYFQTPLDESRKIKSVKSDAAFRSLSLIPRVTPSISSDSRWANTLMENPAPLWVVNRKNDPDTDQPWYYRKQNDDHAAYAFGTGHPGFIDENAVKRAGGSIAALSAAPEAARIVKASFRGDDQFPVTIAIKSAISVLQLSQTGMTWMTPDNYADWIYATMWTPVRIPGGKYGKNPQTITMRNRSSWDLWQADARVTPLVHAMGYFDGPGKKTTVLVLRLQLSDASSSNKLLLMNASCIDVEDPKQGEPDQWDFTPEEQQSQITTSMRWKDKPVFLQAFSARVNMMDMRCFVVDPSGGRVLLASIVCDPTNVYYGRTYLEDATNNNGRQAVDDWTKKDSPSDPAWPVSPFIKPWKCENRRRVILFCQHSAVVGKKFNYRIAVLSLTSVEGKEEFKWSQKLVDQRDIPLRCPNTEPYGRIRSSCFLVGDIIGTRHWPLTESGNQCDQIACVTMSPTYLQLDIVGWRDQESPRTVCKHDCADNLQNGPAGPYQGAGYLRDYFISLVPSQYDQTKVGKGLDILHVSLHKVNDKYYLKFKTHVNDRTTRDGGTVPGREQDYFGSCNVNWIEDNFMSKARYESGRYQSLKWLFIPASDNDQKNAVMEIFSWYGILSMRYFAANWDGKKYTYSMVGVQPYNGQTSGTIGRGIYGTWGEGFIPMGLAGNGNALNTNVHGFEDVNYYNMLLGGSKGHGYWDSANKDTTAWVDPGFNENPIRRESDFVRGLQGDMTPLE